MSYLVLTRTQHDFHPELQLAIEDLKTAISKGARLHTP